MGPSLKRHHTSPSQPASKKQRLNQNEIEASELSAAQHPQISPGKQAARGNQETVAQESMHDLQPPVRSRDGVRSSHEGPGQAYGPREPLHGLQSPARSREGVRSGHERFGQAAGWHETSKQPQHAQPEFETTLLPASQSLNFGSYMHGYQLPRCALQLGITVIVPKQRLCQPRSQELVEKFLVP